MLEPSLCGFVWLDDVALVATPSTCVDTMGQKITPGMLLFVAMWALSAASLATLAIAGPCCESCVEPLKKYYSVDVPHGFCGEACMDPAKFDQYKKFEANLTLVEEGTDNGPCGEQFAPDGSKYADYTKTDTHGVPGLLSVTLNLLDVNKNVPSEAASTNAMLRANAG